MCIKRTYFDLINRSDFDLTNRTDFDLTNRSDFDPTIELNFVLTNGSNLYPINNIATIINLSYPSICIAKARWEWFWCEENIHYSYAITITQWQSSHKCHTSRHNDTCYCKVSVVLQTVHWNGKLVIFMKFSSLAAPKVVILTFDATSNGHFVKMIFPPQRT